MRSSKVLIATNWIELPPVALFTPQAKGQKPLTHEVELFFFQPADSPDLQPQGNIWTFLKAQELSEELPEICGAKEYPAGRVVFLDC